MTAPVKPGTPLPWHVGCFPISPAPRYLHIMPFEGRGAVAKVYASRPDDATYIVTACNAYPDHVALIAELVEALGDCAVELRIMAEWASGPTSEQYESKYKKVCALLSKVKGEGK